MSDPLDRSQTGARDATPQPRERWEERVLGAPRGRIVALLRAGPRTVEDLARPLGVTDNAVRAHLAALQRDGIVARVGTRPSGRKPAITYGLTDEGERLFPKAYGLVLVRLLDALHDRMRGSELQELLAGVGRRLGRGGRGAAGGHADEPLERRLETVLEVFRGLGGVPVLERVGEAYVIRGAGCPLAEAVREHPEVCGLAEALVEELLGAPVRERCDRSGTPSCRFEVGLGAPDLRGKGESPRGDLRIPVSGGDEPGAP